MQTKKQSIIEICTSTAVGFAVSLTATFFVMPLFGFASTPVKNLGITIFYTVISIIRGYVIRRWFNKKAISPKAAGSEYYPPYLYIEPRGFSQEDITRLLKELTKQKP